MKQTHGWLVDVCVWCQTSGSGCGGAADTSGSLMWPHKWCHTGSLWCNWISQAVHPGHLCLVSALVPVSTHLLMEAVWPCHRMQPAGTPVPGRVQRSPKAKLLSSNHTDGRLPQEPESPPEPLTGSVKRVMFVKDIVRDSSSKNKNVVIIYSFSCGQSLYMTQWNTKRR